jgi:C-terminal processing protease CtpA/Prc
MTLIIVAAITVAPAAAGGGGKCDAPLNECIDAMKKMMKSTGWVGIEWKIDPKCGAYVVDSVIPDSPAAAAEIRPGDVLVAINGVPIDEFKKKMAEKKTELKPGRTVSCTIQRDGVAHEINLTLAPMPADVLSKYISEHIRKHGEGTEGGE